MIVKGQQAFQLQLPEVPSSIAMAMKPGLTISDPWDSVTSQDE